MKSLFMKTMPAMALISVKSIFVLFDRSLYGRGFELYVGDDYHVELTLHAFSTKIDIAAYYTFIRDLCRELGLDEFEQEGERCFIPCGSTATQKIITK